MEYSFECFESSSSINMAYTCNNSNFSHAFMCRTKSLNQIGINLDNNSNRVLNSTHCCKILEFIMITSIIF